MSILKKNLHAGLFLLASFAVIYVAYRTSVISPETSQSQVAAVASSSAGSSSHVSKKQAMSLQDSGVTSPNGSGFPVGARIAASQNTGLYAKPNSGYLGGESKGSTGSVSDGPVKSKGSNWYKADFDNGDSGWVVSTSISPSSSYPSPSVTLIASPSYITVGDSSKLTWSAKNVSSCTAPWTTSTASVGSQSLSPKTNTIYMITCTGKGGASNVSTAVHVKSASGVLSPTLAQLVPQGSIQASGITSVSGSQLPAIGPGGPYSGVPGTPVSMASTLVGTFGMLPTYWTFGDGSSASGTYTPSHTYASPGTYTVSLGVTLAPGQISTTTTTATIDYPGIAVSPVPKLPLSIIRFIATPDPAITGNVATFNYAVSDPSSVQGAYISYGDGWEELVNSSTVSHVYASTGTYTAHLYVTWKDGTFTGSARTVNVAAPVLGPAAVLNVTPKLFSSNTIKVTWASTAPGQTLNFARSSVSSTGPFDYVYTLSTSGDPAGTVYSYYDTFPSNLVSGTMYYYSISDANHPENAPGVGNVTISTAAPTTPSNLQIATTYSNELDLTWQESDASANGFSVEQSTDGTNFTELFEPGANMPYYPARNLAANTTYYFRTRSMNAFATSTYSNVVSGKTLVASAPADTAGSHLFVVVNDGTVMPTTLSNFFCLTGTGTLQTTFYTWLKAEANKYGKAAPYVAPSSTCPAQFSVPTSMLYPTFSEDSVITYITTNASVPLATRNSINGAKYVTVVPYLTGNPTAWTASSSPKFAFDPVSPGYTPTVETEGGFIGYYFLLKRGATDKTNPNGQYDTCAVNPATSLPYSNYDVTCGIMASPTNAFEYVPLSRSVVSLPTKTEIGW